jgi:PAS domain S-box-containing protein
MALEAGILNRIKTPLLVCAGKGICYANAVAIQLFGVEGEAFEERAWPKLLPINELLQAAQQHMDEMSVQACDASGNQLQLLIQLHDFEWEGQASKLCFITKADQRGRLPDSAFEPMQHLAVPVFVLDREHLKPIFLNDCFVATFGYQRHEIGSVEEWQAFVFPDLDHREVHLREYQMVLEQIREGQLLEPIKKYARVVCKDGSTKHLLWLVTQSGNEIFGLAIDMSNVQRTDAEALIEVLERNYEHLKNTHVELSREKLLLKDIQSITHTGGWEYLVESGQMYWTEELYQIHEMEKGPDFDHIGQSVKCYLPEDRDKIMAAFKRCVEDGVPYDLVFPFVTYRGNQRWIRTATKPFYRDGKLSRVIGSMSDITEQVLTEQALLRVNRLAAHNEQKFKSIFHSAAIAVLIVDGQMVVQESNAKASELFGYGKEELKGLALQKLIPEKHHQAHAQHELLFISNTEQRSMGVGRKVSARMKDGTEIRVEINLGGVEIDGQKYVTCIVKDISKSVADEQRILDQLEKLKEIAWYQAHLVRQPLTNILGLVNLILEENDFDRGYLEALQRSAKQLDEVIYKIMDTVYRKELL